MHECQTVKLGKEPQKCFTSCAVHELGSSYSSKVDNKVTTAQWPILLTRKELVMHLRNGCSLLKTIYNSHCIFQCTTTVKRALCSSGRHSTVVWEETLGNDTFLDFKSIEYITICRARVLNAPFMKFQNYCLKREKLKCLAELGDHHIHALAVYRNSVHYAHVLDKTNLALLIFFF